LAEVAEAEEAQDGQAHIEVELVEQAVSDITAHLFLNLFHNHLQSVEVDLVEAEASITEILETLEMQQH
jgi:hypothetical protein